VNATQAGTGEIDRYLDGVRAALADLPAEAREELLEDLSAHLAEVAAESGGEPLERRLGTPVAYAAELRAAAGYEPGSGRRASIGTRPAFLRARAAAGRVDVAVGRILGYRTLAEFARLLRPAWWVARGYAVGMLVVNLLLVNDTGLVPRLDSTVFLSLAVLAVTIGVSVRLGRVSVAGRRRVALYAVNVVAALLVLTGVAHAARGSGPVDAYPVTYDPGNVVTDVYPYDSNGEPLKDVVLYDQNGNPLRLGDPSRCSDGDPRAAFRDTYRYPLCALGPGARRAPTGSAPGSASPSVSPSASASPSVPPSVSVSPSR
jgi:hypothetical protein